MGSLGENELLEGWGQGRKSTLGAGVMGNSGMKGRSWSKTCSEFQTVNGGDKEKGSWNRR